MPFRSVSLHVALLAGYHVLAIVHTYPLVWRIGTHLPGHGLGDNVSFVWNGWWMREALASSAADFFGSAPIAAPLFPSLVLHTHNGLAAFLGATLLEPLTVVAAQNVLLIVSLALNGFAAYTLARTVGANRGPSMLAGALFVVAPFVTARLMSHYNLVMVWPLAFACAAYVRWWRTPTLTTAAVMAVAAGLIPYADYYYAVFFGVFAIAYAASQLWNADVDVTGRAHTLSGLLLAALAAIAYAVAIAIAVMPSPVWTLGPVTISTNTPTNALIVGWLLAVAALLWRWCPRLRITRRPLPGLPVARSLLLALALFVVLLVPLVIPAMSNLRSDDYVTQASSLKSSPFGVDLATLVLGPPFNPLVGPLVRRLYEQLGLDVMEVSAWLGVGFMLLLVIAVRGAESTRELRRWVTITGLFVVWALGPFLTVMASNTGILLPQALAHVVPIVNNARMPGRAMAMVVLGALVVLALALSRRQRPVPAWALALCAGLAFIESLAAPLPLATVPSPGVYADIASNGRPGAVLTVPFGVRDGFGMKGRLEHDSLLGQTVHGHSLVGGFLARLPPRVWSWYEHTEPYRTLLALSAGGAAPPLPSCEEVIAGLRSASVDFVVLYPTEASAPLNDFVAGLPLRRVSQDERRVLLEVNATRSPPCDRAQR
jgi:hypothetical protein